MEVRLPCVDVRLPCVQRKVCGCGTCGCVCVCVYVSVRIMRLYERVRACMRARASVLVGK